MVPDIKQPFVHEMTLGANLPRNIEFDVLRGIVWKFKLGNNDELRCVF